MRKITLRSAYKISESKRKRYIQHYQIPSADCLVVPVKDYGEDMSCDVRWEDANGEIHSKSDLVFKGENLTPLNPLIDSQLFEMWNHYYGQN